MRSACIVILFCNIYFVFNQTNFMLFTRHYVSDGYSCNSDDILFVKTISKHSVSCVMYCEQTRDCLSISYDDVTRRCVGCKSFVNNNQADGDSPLLVFEKEVCPEGTEIRRGRSCYYTSPLPNLNFSQSKTFCEERGSNLVKVETDAENQFLKKYFQDRFFTYETDFKKSIWIGMTDTLTEGTWLYIDSGQPVEFTDWAANEPNDYLHLEHCAIFHGYFQWQWVDGNCGYEIVRAFCEHTVDG